MLTDLPYGGPLNVKLFPNPFLTIYLVLYLPIFMSPFSKSVNRTT